MKYQPKLEALESRLTPSTLQPGFFEQTVTTGLNQPTAFALAPDGRFFVTEQTGDLRVVQNGQTLATPFLHLSVDSSGERGLLGVVLDPNFASNSFVYVYYTVPTSPIHNRVSRFTANGNQVMTNSELILMDLDNLSAASNHNGGALHFSTDGKLFIAVGENGNGANSQTLANRLGKILRINPNGSIPTDNPFFNTATGANRAIWALGLRNPFTFAVQPSSGRLFINDVGGSLFEEIDDGIAGSNYGWPNAEGFNNPTNNPNFRAPLFAYPHGSGTQAGFAIAGGAFYNPTVAQFGSGYVGDYFFADFINSWIRVYDPATGGVSDFASNLSVVNPDDLLVDGGGALFYLARGDTSQAGSGVIVRISSTLPANEHFVGLLYSDYLGRAGSMQEVESWANLVPLIGRAQVALDIQRSPEALGNRVTQLYREILGRDPDPTNRAGWASLLANGLPLENVIVGLTSSSTEFATRANALIGTANADVNYVRALYQVLLRRDANTNEVNGWRGVIQSQGRGAVAFQLAISAEFRAGAVRSYYGDSSLSPLPFHGYFLNLLHRGSVPRAAEITAWVNAPIDLLSVEVNIAASAEYFTRQ